MEYIKAQEVIDNVTHQLYSYFESNEIDESILYSEIQKCLGEFKLEHYPIHSTSLQVQDYQCLLPNDYHKLFSIWLCEDVTVTHSDQLQGIVTAEQLVKEIPKCKSIGDYYCNGENLYTIYQFFDTYSLTYNKSIPLVISSDSKKCNQSINTKGNKYDVHVDNNMIKTAFKKGTLYLEYYTTMTEDGEQIIPDNQKIIDWVQKHLIHFCFKRMFYNGTTNVSNQMQVAANELHIAKENARFLFKGNEFTDFIKLKNKLVGNFKTLSRI
jgi:hypothetical protein